MEFVALKISVSLIGAVMANDELTVESTEEFNNFIKRFVPRYMDNKYFKEYKKDSELMMLYDYDTLKFFHNLCEYKKRGIQWINDVR